MAKESKPDQLPSGKWRIRWINEKGKRRSEIFDDPIAANFQLKRKKIEAEEVKSGLRPPQMEVKLFSDFCNTWLDCRTVHKRSPKDDQSIIRCHLIPAFGKLKLHELNLEKVDNFTLSKMHLSPKTMSNVLTLLISILRLARDRNLILTVPNIKKPSTQLFSDEFSYLKSKDEISRFLEAALLEGELVHLMYATAIYTGMRQGELAALTFEDIDFEKRSITVSKSFSGPTKNKIIRRVPIFDPILEPLKLWKLKLGRGLVFPNKKEKMHGRSARIFQEVLHRILEKGGFDFCHNQAKRKRYIVFHDLRHTFASTWMMNGGDLFKLQKLLGHKEIAMTLRYAHLTPDAWASEYGRFGNKSLYKNAEIISLHSSH